MVVEILFAVLGGIGALVWAWTQGAARGRSKERELQTKAQHKHTEESKQFTKDVITNLAVRLKEAQDKHKTVVASIENRINDELADPKLSATDAKARVERAIRAYKDS